MKYLSVCPFIKQSSIKFTYSFHSPTFFCGCSIYFIINLVAQSNNGLFSGLKKQESPVSNPFYIIWFNQFNLIIASFIFCSQRMRLVITFNLYNVEVEDQDYAKFIFYIDYLILPVFAITKAIMKNDFAYPGFICRALVTNYSLFTQSPKMQVMMDELLQYLNSSLLSPIAIRYFYKDYSQSPISQQASPKDEWKLRFVVYCLLLFYSYICSTRKSEFKSFFLLNKFISALYLTSYSPLLLLTYSHASLEQLFIYFTISFQSFFRHSQRQGFILYAYNFIFYDYYLQSLRFKQTQQRQQIFAVQWSIDSKLLRIYQAEFQSFFSINSAAYCKPF